MPSSQPLKTAMVTVLLVAVLERLGPGRRQPEHPARQSAAATAAVRASVMTRVHGVSCRSVGPRTGQWRCRCGDRWCGRTAAAPTVLDGAIGSRGRGRCCGVGASIGAAARAARPPRAAVTRSRKMARITTDRPASKPRATSMRVEALHDRAAEAAGADHAGDDDHRQREHDDLVDAGHDGRHRERQLDAGAGCGPGGAERVAGLDDLLVDAAGCRAR